ncbi:hypothetical protein PPYR_03123 [Photinus pyralis]|uniref:Neurotransmitter-gated ion-channel ligand-binding domain-containing protein n=2 Tax=Photinus pyralis TaxID=7054 RepID=A0A5N4A1W7_PHOPY|nr:acetylcholine receptor subunit beta-like 1 [Photinus pyralis]KAB0791323.1 hypothetical protein PPYR_03123 [Photinus pyralis]
MIRLLIVIAWFYVSCARGDGVHDHGRRTVSNPLWNETSLDKLRNDLLLNYDKFAKAVEGNVTEVGIGLTIVYVETDELNSTFTSSMWLKLSWKDPKLVWSSQDYNGIDSLKMADHEIWQPDIYLFNGANTGGEPIIRYGNPYALVQPDGSVVWVPPIKLTALCDFDMYYWPFDTQRCYLRFGSGSRSRADIRLVSKGVDFKTAIPIVQWTIACTDTIVEVTRAGYPDQFYHVLYNLTLTRKPSTTTTVATTVICCSACLVLAQRFLTFKTGRGLILRCLTSVVLCIFLVYFGTRVAPKRSAAPWIVSFLSACLFLHCITVIESVMVTCMSKLSNPKRVAWKVKGWLGGRFGRILLLDDCIVECERCVDSTDDQHGGKCAASHDWELCHIAIDRLLFLIYFLILALLILAYII